MGDAHAMNRAAAIPVLAAAVFVSGIGQAAERTYERCMKLAHTAPDKALAEAKAWWKSGGGRGARHCVAVALVTKGHYRQGAKVLTDLARDAKGAEQQLRPELLAQAGQAWLMAGDTKTALQRYDEALGLDPNSAALFVDRAVAYGTLGRLRKAIDDLNAALALDPSMAEAWLLRAAAHRKLRSLALAASDAERATTLAPKHAEAWLERGVIHRLSGDIAGAEAAWKRAVSLDRRGQAARHAQANLDRLNAAKTGPQPAPAQPSPSR